MVLYVECGDNIRLSVYYTAEETFFCSCCFLSGTVKLLVRWSWYHATAKLSELGNSVHGFGPMPVKAAELSVRAGCFTLGGNHR